MLTKVLYKSKKSTIKTETFYSKVALKQNTIHVFYCSMYVHIRYLPFCEGEAWKRPLQLRQ